jgi:hypothetical protein
VSPRQGASPSLETALGGTCSRIQVGYLAFNLSGYPGVTG